MTTIRMDELTAELDRLSAASAGTVDGNTAREIAVAMGHCKQWVTEQLRAGVAAGIVACANGHRLNMAGVRYQTPVYRLVKKGRAK